MKEERHRMPDEKILQPSSLSQDEGCRIFMSAERWSVDANEDTTTMVPGLCALGEHWEGYRV